MIDAHCHLEHMPPEVIEEARPKMTAIVTSIADIKDKHAVIEMRKNNAGFVFICLGFHPEVMGQYNDKDIDSYIDFIRQNKKEISAVGEVGLDYNWNTKVDEQQKSKEIFLKFIGLSKELQLPLVIHSRNGRTPDSDGIGDAISMLIENNCKDVMMHCFSGSESQLKTCMEQGWMISYATVLVKSFKHQRLAKMTPLGQMLLETDAPWLDPDAPPKTFGQQPHLTNRPWKIERSAEVIAGLKDVSKEEILSVTERNAKRFFRI